MFKRIFLFVVMNIAIIAMISIIFTIFNVQPYITPYGLNFQSLLIFSAIIGFAGSFFSLLLSKWMAKFAYKIQIIDTPQDNQEAEILTIVKNLSEQLNIGMPEVGIYTSPEVNAFATGANRNNALVAVSAGLLENLDKQELEGVIGHEMSHIANGDMITMTLLQGVLNTFVIFFARIAAYLIQAALRDDDNGRIGGFAYMMTAWIFEIIFGIFASTILFWFSRKREFKADSGSAKLLGKNRMIKALKKLQELYDLPVDKRGKSFSTMKISNRPSVFRLFASHPKLEDRIEALEKGNF